jgi:hypothetical protein
MPPAKTTTAAASPLVECQYLTGALGLLSVLLGFIFNFISFIRKWVPEKLVQLVASPVAKRAVMTDSVQADNDRQDLVQYRQDKLAAKEQIALHRENIVGQRATGAGGAGGGVLGPVGTAGAAGDHRGGLAARGAGQGGPAGGREMAVAAARAAFGRGG